MKFLNPTISFEQFLKARAESLHSLIFRELGLTSDVVGGTSRYRMYGAGCGFSSVHVDKRKKRVVEALRIAQSYRKMDFAEWFLSTHFKEDDVDRYQLRPLLAQNINVNIWHSERIAEWIEFQTGYDQKLVRIDSRLD